MAERLPDAVQDDEDRIRNEAFGQTKNWTTVTLRQASRDYLLIAKDLEGLPFVEKTSAYQGASHDTEAEDDEAQLSYSPSGGEMMQLYYLTDIQDRALDKFGSKEALDAAVTARNQKRRRRRQKVASRTGGRLRFWRHAMVDLPHHTPGIDPNTAATVGKRSSPVGLRAVSTAIAGNAVVCLAKALGFAVTGSGSMLSEAVHSLADTTNQGLLAYGIVQSQKEADQTHPYGYLTEQYVWSLVSGVGIFFLGCGVSVYHGVSVLLNPEPLHNLEVAIGVLGFAGAVEGYTMKVAYEEMRAEAAKVSPLLCLCGRCAPILS